MTALGGGVGGPPGGKKGRGRKKNRGSETPKNTAKKKGLRVENRGPRGGTLTLSPKITPTFPKSSPFPSKILGVADSPPSGGGATIVPLPNFHNGINATNKEQY